MITFTLTFISLPLDLSVAKMCPIVEGPGQFPLIQHGLPFKL